MSKSLKIFPESYKEGRSDFIKALKSAKYFHEQYSIDEIGKDEEILTIDIGTRGLTNAKRAVVISSGLHGVEGFLGSAVQRKFLNDPYLLALKEDINIIIIHALNPYGFSWVRRCNEENIDLNRNFLLPDEAYSGGPKDYYKFNNFLNPESEPSRIEPFLIKIFWLITRHGFTTLMNTFPEGQYNYPKGLFFGGAKKSNTQKILYENLPRLIGNASEVIHIDLHTGLGKLNTFKLLIDETDKQEQHERLIKRFGNDNIEIFNIRGSAYKVRGGLGSWCKTLLPNCRYDFLTAEFGTYSAIQILKSLRAENRSYWWGNSAKHNEWTKRQLLEMFAPINQQWRKYSVLEGLMICKQAVMINNDDE